MLALISMKNNIVLAVTVSTFHAHIQYCITVNIHYIIINIYCLIINLKITTNFVVNNELL